MLRFRTFNAEQNKNTTLKNMLSFGEGLSAAADFDGVYEYILSNPEKVILIFDGLDELQVDCDNCYREAEDTPNDYNGTTGACLYFLFLKSWFMVNFCLVQQY